MAMTPEELRAYNREKMRRWMAKPENREKARRRHEARRRERGSKPRPGADELASAFWAKTEQWGACLEWTGWSLTKPGSEYGVVRRRPGRILAHRMAYELTIGPVPKDKMVLHRCDNPKCVRPDHLFLGDQTVNMRDAKAKGRMRGYFSKGRQRV